MLAGAASALWIPARAQPAEVREALAQPVLAGSGRLTFWGFHVYDAALWVAPGFRADQWERHALVLELEYARDFTREAIAERSIDEMRRQSPLTEAQARQWQTALAGAFPDVRRGDRIAGVYRPDGTLRFLTNGQLTGEIRDARLAPLFMGIWLSPRTSEPALRRSLLAQAQAQAQP